MSSKFGSAEPRKQAGKFVREERDLEVKLEQDAAGGWLLKLNGGQPYPATDAEVVLWKRCLAAEARARAYGKAR